jgi:hypothetical protein
MANYNSGTLDPSNIPYSVNNYSVSFSDKTDIFRFQLSSISDINISLDSINGDADLILYRDNGNGYWDSNDSQIASSYWGGAYDDSVNLADQSAGTYFAKVYYYSSSTNNVNYNLDISTTRNYNASNLLPKEVIVGSIDSPDSITYRGSVGASDTTDTYYFTVSSHWGTHITLEGLSSDADIRLIHDTNKNGIVDNGEVMRASTNGGTVSELLSYIPYTGGLFLQVYQHSGDTNYNLTFTGYANPS